MIEIINIRNTTFDANDPTHFKIDRQSPIGNPFNIEHSSQRDKVCDKYEIYFAEEMNKKCSEFTTYINKLVVAYGVHGKLILFCWCSPKRCHGETIRNYILKQTEEKW